MGGGWGAPHESEIEVCTFAKSRACTAGNHSCCEAYEGLENVEPDVNAPQHTVVHRLDDS